MLTSFLLFHQNLAFSSIHEDRRLDVIQNCYWPLLDIIERMQIKTCIEATGWTLEECARLDSAYIAKLRVLIESGLVELVGSGYCQIIGPLVPYRVNYENQRLGRLVYRELLSVSPTSALINEMAYSPGCLDAYSDTNYQKLFMDCDNVALAAGFNDKSALTRHKYLSNSAGTKLKAIWTDSILFQKFQRLAHGQITFDEYLEDFQSFIEKYDGPIPVYCNDAEVFDFRPGRYREEANCHPDGEWRRIEKLIDMLKEQFGCTFEHSNALEGSFDETILLDSMHMPIAVKKQPKYNIARWAVTGRDDNRLNTKCYAILDALIDRDNADDDAWKQLCRFWASDLRTHITEDRWKKIQDEISGFKEVSPLAFRDTGRSDFVTNPELQERLFFQENEALYLKCEQCEIVWDLRKGAAIRKLAFTSHRHVESIGSYSHGYFDDIQLGADFLSGSLLLDDLEERKRYTDYASVEPEIDFNDDYIRIRCRMKIWRTEVLKTFLIGLKNPSVTLSFMSEDIPEADAILRIGNFLLKNFDDKTRVIFNTGGKQDDLFEINGYFDHSSSVSTFVSSSTGMSAPTGRIQFGDSNFGLIFSWQNSANYLFPMMLIREASPNDFMRLIFSKSEVDDTYKSKSLSVNSSVTIEPVI